MISMMNEYLEYQKSVALEFQAYKDRIRYMIGNHHWGEDGRYKEILLINYLRRMLPNTVSVGTGFVRNKEKLTSQIDIIIYANNIPLLFSEGDFIITTPENVIGIIEVKSTAYASNIGKIIEKANRNAFIICEENERILFNGIFAYDISHASDNTFIHNIEAIDYSEIVGTPTARTRCTAKGFQCVNHIVLGSQRFVKYFPTGYPYLTDISMPVKSPYYGLYNMFDELAIAYFISNLQEYVLDSTLPVQQQEYLDLSELYKFFYPIKEGKETRLVGKAIMAKELENIIY